MNNRKIVVLVLFSISFGFVNGKTKKELAPIGELNIGKAMQKVSKKSIFENDSLFTWGTSPIKGIDGKYHVFYARWHKKFSFNAWVTHSEIAHGVSNKALGPYKFSDVSLPERGRDYWDGHYTHNPLFIILMENTICITPEIMVTG